MGREYRLDELAEASGVRARTLRFYRERGLLQAPRREGRIAWYNDDHLARVRTVAALVERGHTLGGIAELIAAFESGRDVRGAAELLGLPGALAKPWSEETPVRLTPEELATRFGGGTEEVSAENLADALDIGYVAVEGEEFVHVSQRLLDVSGELVKKGVPLAVVLAAGREVRTHADALAELFTGIVRKHLLADVLDSPADLTPEQVARITDTIERLRPMAKQVLEAEVTMAMDRRVQAELEEWQREAEEG
ncbi:MerR family transcriptional regulator [Streptomyces sp. A7024]|uniref:MerR family transcriptional regulator n=1 Tax=Streptomyces coryli TaxID=1128680 RepID=A0A6G4U9I3_9ACTN|nr:MerR family transcriptional regulator [Streptomyces coryli]NGN68783.1 MerR family transcriptional regulator [Streptomyces coryli]